MPATAGILNREEITAEIANGLIANHLAANIKSCSYDMRIGTIFDKGTRITAGSLILQPGAIVSLFTHETLKLRNDMTATAFAMNSMSSQGLLVLNPGHVDPGYEGPLTVRLINLRARPKAILINDPVFTVVFERLPNATQKGYEKNISRDAAEQQFAGIDLEQNPGNLFELVRASDNNNFLTAEEVDRRISEHWMGQTIFVMTAIAGFGAIVAVLIAMVTLYYTVHPTDQASAATSASSGQIAAPLPDLNIGQTGHVVPGDGQRQNLPAAAAESESAGGPKGAIGTPSVSQSKPATSSHKN